MIYGCYIVLRARARQLALIVVSDIQPVQNLRVLTRIAAKCGGDEHKQEWGISIYMHALSH